MWHSYTELFHLLFTIIFKNKENLDNNAPENPPKTPFYNCTEMSDILRNESLFGYRDFTYVYIDTAFDKTLVLGFVNRFLFGDYTTLSV